MLKRAGKWWGFAGSGLGKGKSREQSGERSRTLWQQWASDWVRSRREIWALRDAQISSLRGGDVLAPRAWKQTVRGHTGGRKDHFLLDVVCWRWWQVTRRMAPFSNQERLKFKRDIRGPGAVGLGLIPQVRSGAPTDSHRRRSTCGSGQLPQTTMMWTVRLSLPFPLTTNSRSRQAPRVRGQLPTLHVQTESRLLTHVSEKWMTGKCSASRQLREVGAEKPKGKNKEPGRPETGGKNPSQKVQRAWHCQQKACKRDAKQEERNFQKPRAGTHKTEQGPATTLRPSARGGRARENASASRGHYDSGENHF